MRSLRNGIYEDGEKEIVFCLFYLSIYLLGCSISRDGKALSSSKKLKGKIEIHPEKTRGIKTESGWNSVSDCAEHFVLENIPFLSFCFIIFILLCQAAAEVAQEWEIDGFLFIPVLVACLVLYIKRKTIYSHQK